MSATAVFGLVLLVLLFFRAHDRSVLAEIQSGKSSGGKDYATLLSKDKTDGFHKNDHSADSQTDPTKPSPTATAQQQSLSSSFTVTSPGPSPSTPGTAPPPTGGAPPPTGSVPPPTGGVPPPASPFTAKVVGIRQDGASPVDCSGAQIPSPSQCVRRYYFTADVAAYNGPGSVTYEWRLSVPGSNIGSYPAGSGQSLTSLHKVVVISCDTPPGQFEVQMRISSPNQSASDDIKAMHDCGGGLTPP